MSSQSRGFHKSRFANCADIILLAEVSFNVVLQFLLEVKPFLADGTFPILYPLVDQLVFGSGWRSPEHLLAREPAFVLLLTGVLCHVHSKVVLRVATEVTRWAGERIWWSFMRNFLVKVISAFGQILCVAKVTFEGKNSSVPKYVVFQCHICFVSFSTFLTDEISGITVLHHMSIHAPLA